MVCRPQNLLYPLPASYFTSDKNIPLQKNMIKKNASTILIVLVALALILLVIIITNDKINKLEQGVDDHGNVQR